MYVWSYGIPAAFYRDRSQATNRHEGPGSTAAVDSMGGYRCFDMF